MIAVSEEFLSGMVLGVICALVGSLTTFVWMLYRSIDDPPDDPPSWDDDDPLFPPSEWSDEFEDERWTFK